MSYLGLVPRECSSGERERRGAITKAGNGHLRQRRRDQPVRVIAIADRAQERLWRRCCRLAFRGKPTQKVVVAMARELVGYIWAVLRPEAQATVVD